MSRAVRFVSRSKGRLALFGAALALLVGAAAAIAYFTSTASGSAAGQVGTLSAPVTISAAAPTQALYPGASADLAATADNSNSAVAHVISLALDTSQGTGGFDVDTTHQTAGCTVAAADLSYTTQNDGGSGWNVPAKVGSTDGTLPLDLTGAVSMAAGAANACQGATFTVYLKVGP